jgi:hypothetical protein
MAVEDVPVRRSVHEMVGEVVDMVNNMTAEEAKRVEDGYWMRTLGTTDLAARGYRSFWD